MAIININLPFFGNVSCGKSTMIGNLLLKTGTIVEREFLRNEKMAIEMGKPSYKYSYIVDRNPREKEQGRTIDLHYWEIRTPTHSFIAPNMPGHYEFTRQLYQGISQGDYGVLIVAATRGELESVHLEQTKMQSIIAFTVGIRFLIVAVNKMDEFNVDYSQERFDQVVKETTEMLNTIGFKSKNLVFVPVSGLMGINVKDKPNNKLADWYKGSTLLEEMCKLKEPPRPIDKPLRISVSNCFRIGGVGTVPIGRVEYGSYKVGSPLLISPSFLVTNTRCIERCFNILNTCNAGELVGLNITGISRFEVKKGDVIGDPKQSPPSKTDSFIGQIMVLNQPTNGIKNGYCPTLFIHNLKIPCTFTKILYTIDKETDNPTENITKENLVLKNGDSAMVEFQLPRLVCIEEYAQFPALGRFIMMDKHKIVALGVVKNLNSRIEFKK